MALPKKTAVEIFTPDYWEEACRHLEFFQAGELERQLDRLFKAVVKSMKGEGERYAGEIVKLVEGFCDTLVWQGPEGMAKLAMIMQAIENGELYALDMNGVDKSTVPNMKTDTIEEMHDKAAKTALAEGMHGDQKIIPAEEDHN